MSSIAAAASAGYEHIDPESDAVHAWRVDRLTSLGVAWPAAEAAADRVDWHDIARLVKLGCPASLALAIIQ